MTKVVLVTGITGQDGSIAAELWLHHGYQVHGVVRRSSNFNTKRINRILDKIHLHYGDITDMGNVLAIIQKIKPSMILNFAAMSHVKVSFELENYTFQTNTIGILNILQALKTLELHDTTRVYHASTSEMFGNVGGVLNENSPMLPVSPYGISKLAAHNICNYYKKAYNIFVVSGILFNHEGERRGHTFVTQKIADYVAKYKFGLANYPLQLGNIDAKRDWGYAPDYVEAIYKMMHHQTPDDYVIATGQCHSIRDFLELAFQEIGINIHWNENAGFHNNKKIIQYNTKYDRPIDIHVLVGDASKAKNILDWTPTTTFSQLVKVMVQAAIKRQAVIA